MKKYELNPKEEIKVELRPNVFDQERSKNQILLLGIVAGAIITWFFYYVMTSISSFYPLFLIMLLITGIASIIYLYSLIKGIKGISNERYIVTNVRLVVVNNDNEVLKEVYLSKIFRTITNKVAGKSYDVIINPKLESDPKRLRHHRSSKPLYTNDTLILHAINIDKIGELVLR
ncbi:MAG: hypothetical protein PHP11_04240 [Erysipelotrichaceae bacterium]|nr:hypothetical protein [Erysipelotrichaceae bacterium]MDD3924295.1 hypothetical protein [Erysipelotrichaceae bacterium]MDD4642500.1 hypothetical protein [Erysipelotrichaceae bacterium]